ARSGRGPGPADVRPAALAARVTAPAAAAAAESPVIRAPEQPALGEVGTVGHLAVGAPARVVARRDVVLVRWIAVAERRPGQHGAGVRPAGQHAAVADVVGIVVAGPGRALRRA